MPHQNLHLPEATQKTSPLIPAGEPRAAQPKVEVRKLDANDALVRKGKELLNKKASFSGTTLEGMGDESELKGLLPDHYDDAAKDNRELLDSVGEGTPKVTRMLTMRQRIEGILLPENPPIGGIRGRKEEHVIDEDLDALEQEQEKEAADTAARDREMHARWVSSGHDPQHLEPLLRRYEPFIARKTMQLSGGALTNQSAVRQNVTNKVLDAFRTYDPNRGTALNTHVQNLAQGALRSVISSQNMARIPEKDALHIGKIDRAKAQYQEDYGELPTQEQLAQHMGISRKFLAQVEKRRIRDISSGGSEAPLAQQGADRAREVLPLLRNRLRNTMPGSLEEKVFVSLYGEDGLSGGTPKRTGVLAKQFGVKDHNISRAKTELERMLKEHGV